MLRAIIPTPNGSKPSCRVRPGLVLESVLPSVRQGSSVHPRGSQGVAGGPEREELLAELNLWAGVTTHRALHPAGQG